MSDNPRAIPSPSQSATRQFDPPAEGAASVNVGADAYELASVDRESFWATQADRLSWARPWSRVLDWDDPPHAEWFVGGRLNAAYNCVDRHVDAGNGERVAIHWVGNSSGEARDITYAELRTEVSRAANALLALGVAPGDRVVIYLGMIPEAVIAMLACARIGAVHTVVYSSLPTAALAVRIADCGAKVVVTADGVFNGSTPSVLKIAVDAALADLGPTGTVNHVLVVRRTGQRIEFDENVDVWWHDALGAAAPYHPPPAFDAEHPLFLSYTSGTTGSPRGIVHTTGGYLTQAAYTHHAMFDLKPVTDVYWCTADLGWITGHSYVVYGPMANGATQILFEGTPNWPEAGRWWQIIERYRVTILYTAPTAIRSFMKQGREICDRFDLSSLRLLGSAGETLDRETYRWYQSVIGADRTPVVDTWWQTETGAALIAPLPGVTSGKPGAVTAALPGITVDVVDDQGVSVPPGSRGLLVITSPWPSMLRSVWGGDNRYIATYWSLFARHGFYFTGDAATRDEEGDIWILGRVDDVMNVRGHRLSTSEVESALVSHPNVAELAVVGAPDPDTGQAVLAYVVLRDGTDSGDRQLIRELSEQVSAMIGPMAVPREITIVPELPKTRSGKIVRRLLRDIAERRAIGDTTTLLDASVVTRLLPSRSGSLPGVP